MNSFRDGLAEVLQVQHLVLQPQQLLVAIPEIILNEFLDIFALRMLSSSVAAMSTRAIRASTRFLRLMYLLRSGSARSSPVGSRVEASDTVDSPETLDDTNRVPVDVVVDEVVAILKVLALGDAVGGDQDVDLAILGH